jgi:hypothetical protein
MMHHSSFVLVDFLEVEGYLKFLGGFVFCLFGVIWGVGVFCCFVLFWVFLF